MFPCFAGMGPQGVEPRGSPAQTTRRDAYYSGDPRDREPPREHSAQRGPTGLQTSPITPEHGQYYAGQQGEDPWSTFQPLPPPNYYGMFPSYAPYGPQYGPQGLVSRAYGGFGAPHLRFPGPPLPRDTPPRPPPPPPPQTPAWTKEIRSMRGELEDSLAKAMGVLCSTIDKRLSGGARAPSHLEYEGGARGQAAQSTAPAALGAAPRESALMPPPLTRGGHIEPPAPPPGQAPGPVAPVIHREITLSDMFEPSIAGVSAIAGASHLTDNARTSTPRVEPVCSPGARSREHTSAPWVEPQCSPGARASTHNPRVEPSCSLGVTSLTGVELPGGSPHSRTRDRSLAGRVEEPPSPSTHSHERSDRTSSRGSCRSVSESSRASSRGSSAESRSSRDSRAHSVSSQRETSRTRSPDHTLPRAYREDLHRRRKRAGSPRTHGSPSPKRRRRPDGIPEPTEADIIMHQATLVDLFCKEHKDYDRRNKQDVQRIESKFRTTAYARQELIKKWKREKKEFLRKQELRTRSETDASHPTQESSPSQPPLLSPMHGDSDALVRGTAPSVASPSRSGPATPPTLVADPGRPHTATTGGDTHAHTPTLPVLDLNHPQPLLQITGASTQEDKRKAKEQIRTILHESTAIRNIKPAVLPSEEKREKLSVWDSSARGEPKHKEERLAWPVHFRVKEVTDSFNKNLAKLNEHETNLRAVEYSRIPTSALPDLDYSEYVLMSEVHPGWTGKRPVSAAPLEKQVIPDKTTAEVSVKGLREAAGDWRQTLSLASVLSHSIDTLDELAKIPAAERTPQMVKDNLEVARAGLSKLILTSAKNVASHELWERKRTQNSFLDASLARLEVKDLAECRTGPIDSEEFIFGSQRNMHTDKVKARMEERLHTIQVRIDDKPQQHQKQPFRKSTGGNTSKADQPKPGTSGKPKSRSHKKSKKQDKAGQDKKQAKVDSPKADQPEPAAGKKPRYHKNKSKKKTQSAKQAE